MSIEIPELDRKSNPFLILCTRIIRKSTKINKTQNTHNQLRYSPNLVATLKCRIYLLSNNPQVPSERRHRWTLWYNSKQHKKKIVNHKTCIHHFVFSALNRRKRNSHPCLSDSKHRETKKTFFWHAYTNSSSPNLLKIKRMKGQNLQPDL